MYMVLFIGIVAVVVVFVSQRRQTEACSENEPSDKGLSIVLKGRSRCRNDDIIVSYHCYQECNDDTVLKTMPQYTPILCYAIQAQSVSERETETETEKQNVHFVLLSIHFRHKYNHLMRMNNGIFSVWIFAYFISWFRSVCTVCGVWLGQSLNRTRFWIAFCMQTKMNNSFMLFSSRTKHTSNSYIL